MHYRVYGDAWQKQIRMYMPNEFASALDTKMLFSAFFQNIIKHQTLKILSKENIERQKQDTGEQGHVINNCDHRTHLTQAQTRKYIREQ